MGVEKTEAGLEQAILRNASGPRSAQSDDQRVEQHPLSDMVMADRYLASKKAAKSRGGGIRFRKMVHSGA